MDPNISTLRYIVQAFVDSHRLSVFRYTDGHGGGREEITFLKEGGEPIAVLRTPYLPNIVELQNVRPFRNDTIYTNLIFEFIPALPNNETNFEDFIGKQNIVVPNILFHRHDIRERNMFPSLARSVSPKPLAMHHRAAYQMTPEYLAAEFKAECEGECKAHAMQEPSTTQTE